MHYTAMSGLAVEPMAMATTSLPPALSVDLLAIVVAIVAFLVSGIFLLTLVPDRLAAAPQLLTGEAPSPTPPDALEPTAPAPLVAAVPSGPAPLGGIGRPPRRNGSRIPVERAGATHLLAPEEVFAVHANAHYTYVFNGTDDLFCSLSISELEGRLDRTQFLRVHRSHIVNLGRIVAIRRAGDTGQVELAGGSRRMVPVSRAKLSGLRAQVEGKASADLDHSAAE
jgi:hypothetical protein